MAVNISPVALVVILALCALGGVTALFGVLAAIRAVTDDGED